MKEILNELEKLGNPILHISLNDLKELVKSLNEENYNNPEKALSALLTRFMLSRKEIADIFGFSSVGLYQWNKRGYLTPVNIGGIAMYQLSDINELMTNPDFPTPQAHNRIMKKKKLKERIEEREIADGEYNYNPMTMNNPKFITIPESSVYSSTIEKFEVDDLPF